LYRCGRWLTVVLAGLAVMSLLSQRARRPTAQEALAGSTRPEAEPQLLEAADTLDLAGLQEKFQAVARNVAPAVVAISAAETACDSEAAYRATEMNGGKLQDILGKTTRTVGTGFIFDADGYILTNEHVIEDSEQFWVTTDDRKVYPALVVGSDPRADLAVLKIPAGKLPTVHFSSAACRRGQWVITLGNPYGLATEGEMALSVGVISATDRALPRLANRENRLYSHLIQTTAQINPGNSGGPLFDLNGEVIGVNAAVILPQKQTNGIGFAIPVTPQLLAEIGDLQQGREVIYGYFGVIVTTPTIGERRDLGLAADLGVRIDSVEADCPASAPGGLRVADVVTQFNGQDLADSDQFVRLVGSAPIGIATQLRVLRDGHWTDVKIAPIKRPVQNAVSSQNQRLHWRGLVVGPIPSNWGGCGAIPAAGKDKHAAGLLVVSITNDSPLKKQGIAAGSIITSIGNRPITTLREMQQILNDLPPAQCTVQVAPTPTQVVSAPK